MFGCLGNGLHNVQWFVFFEFLTLFILRVVTFSFLIHFLLLLMCQMHQEEVLKFCLNIKNNSTLPLDSACLKHLSVQSPAVLPWIWKAKKKDFFLYSWLHNGTYHKKLMIWIFFTNFDNFGSIFSWFFFFV